MRSFVLASFAGIALSLSTAAADVVFLSAAADNTLFQSATGALSNGSGPNVFAGRNSQGAIRRALLRFDLSAIPDGATITGVSLTLTASQTQGPATDMGLHRTLAPWGEGASSSTGGGGAAAQPGDATWLHTFFHTTFWTNSGGDFAPLASATQSVFEPGMYTWASTPQLIADAQGWLDAPEENFGWTLLGREDIMGTAKRFESRENAEADVRPLLAVEYVIPAPGAGACLLLPLAAWARRRR
jgi:hypothetical protein